MHKDYALISAADYALAQTDLRSSSSLCCGGASELRFRQRGDPALLDPVHDRAELGRGKSAWQPWRRRDRSLKFLISCGPAGGNLAAGEFSIAIWDLIRAGVVNDVNEIEPLGFRA